MRKFSSYGPIDKELHYYVPREELVSYGLKQLTGINPEKGGHYITVWAPRQTGKTWIMQQILWQLQKDQHFDVAKINVQHLQSSRSELDILNTIASDLGRQLNISYSDFNKLEDFQKVFSRAKLKKPLILIIDEFDALFEKAINQIAAIFRNIHLIRQDEIHKKSHEKSYLLHGVALIGVRSVLGIENVKGSPFNVQRSLHITNLTRQEVGQLFEQYQQESAQIIESQVIERIWYEFRGQPGLTCWFGELLTETYNKDKNSPIGMEQFEYVYLYATDALPNNNILNIISKVQEPLNKETSLELFKTDEKIEFKFDHKNLNYLYMNGVIDYEEDIKQKKLYCKYANPFVQGRLFNYFSQEIFSYPGTLVSPLDKMEDAITESKLFIPNIIKRYKEYLQQQKELIFKNVPRRKTDHRIMEAVYHFNLFRYLYDLLKSWDISVVPEFPTGNGKIDLVLIYKQQKYLIELKSFKNYREYDKAIEQAGKYCQQIDVQEIILIMFTELTEADAKELHQQLEIDGNRIVVIPIGIL